MGRHREDGSGRPIFDDIAAIHHDDVARYPGDGAQIMADIEQRHIALFGQGDQQGIDARGDTGVERGSGLVGDQQGRIAGKCRGDQHALALPARELVGILRQPRFGLGHADLVEQLEHAAAGLAAIETAMQQQRFGNDVADPLERVEGAERLLEHHGNGAGAMTSPGAFAGPHHFLAVEPDRAGDRGALGHHAEQGQGGDRLAAAAFAHNADPVAAPDAEAGAPHRLVAPETDGEIGNIEHVSASAAGADRPDRAARRPEG